MGEKGLLCIQTSRVTKSRMPSPIAHTAIGYLIFKVQRRGDVRKGQKWTRAVAPTLIVVLGLSILPDLDSVAGILMGDFGSYHNNWTHSLLIGLGVALVIGSLVWLMRHSGFGRWFIITLLCYELHVVMDYFTIGRGVMAFWPFSLERFASPVPVFYGLRWSDGWLSTRHLFTITTEVGFIILVVIIAHSNLIRKNLIRRFTRD